jgi:hypothetical protein
MGRSGGAQTRRDRCGRFAPGASGTPAGNLKATPNRMTMLRLTLDVDESGKIARVVIDRAPASEGDLQSACNFSSRARRGPAFARLRIGLHPACIWTRSITIRGAVRGRRGGSPRHAAATLFGMTPSGECAPKTALRDSLAGR